MSDEDEGKDKEEEEEEEEEEETSPHTKIRKPKHICVCGKHVLVLPISHAACFTSWFKTARKCYVSPIILLSVASH